MDDLDILTGIVESRLLFPTKLEFINHIGSNRLKSQSFKTVFATPFERRAVRCALENDMYEVSHGRIDLESVVEDYMTASAFYDSVKRYQFLIDKDSQTYKQHVLKLLEDVLPMKHYPVNMTKSEQKLYERIYDREENKYQVNLAILFLMLLKHLPGYRNRSDATDIQSESLAMLKDLEEWDWGDIVNIDYYRAYVKRAANLKAECGLPLLNRCILISLVEEMFFLIGAENNDWRQKYSQEVSESPWQDINTPCLWKEKADTNGARNTFYRLQKAADCFFVYKNTIRNSKIYTEKNELRLTYTPSLLPGVLLQNIKSGHKKMRDEVILFGQFFKPDYYKCVIIDDDEDTKTFFDNSLQLIATIHVSSDWSVVDVVFRYRNSTGPHSQTFIPVLKSIDKETYRTLAAKILRFQHINVGIRSMLHRTMVAITWESLYFGIPTDQDARKSRRINKYIGYYKVPIDLFDISPDSISFQEPFGYIIFDYEKDGLTITRTFIGHASTETYFEVTTKEKCQENHIERMDILTLDDK